VLTNIQFHYSKAWI